MLRCNKVSFRVRARNNLDIPIRLTITQSSEILITIGKKGASLKQYYLACIDADLPPSQDWEEVGQLDIKTKHFVSFRGREDENE